VKKERVAEIIDVVAAGNNNLKLVMMDVYRCGRDIIDTWPEGNTGLLVRKTLKATGLLIHQGIEVREMVNLKEKYWETENGKKVDTALIKYVEMRKKS